jgi:hypothetical protein
MKIYALCDPRDCAVKYIGVTSTELRQRLHSHMWSKRDGSPRGVWLSELFALGFRPTIFKIEDVMLGKASDRERYWIAEYRKLGAALVNSENGLPGFLGGNLSEEQKQRIGDRNRGTKRKWANPEERSRKLSDALTGKPKSREQVIALANRRRGKSKLPQHVQDLIRERHKSGVSMAAIAREIGCSHTAVSFIVVGPPKLRQGRYKFT